MSKIKTILPVKGIRTPRFLIWFRGFLHGKILHTGGLDFDTNLISSGYVTGQIKRFRNACIGRREQAEAKLSSIWAEADQLLIDFAYISVSLDSLNKRQGSLNENSTQLRANEKTASKRASFEAQRQEILKKIANIANSICLEFNSAHDQMEATAEILASTFACYGHGLLMKPVYTHNLPALVYEDCAKQIIISREDTWNAIVSILKEVKE